MALSAEEELELIRLLEAQLVVEARRSFSHFRRQIRPQDKRGWWQQEIETALQKFYDDFRQQRRPILIVEAPPQHGKSSIVTDFIAWVAGQDPDLAQIYASRAERLGTRANLYLQRLLSSERYRLVFPHTRINDSNVVTQAGQYQRNREMLEFVSRLGSFRNVTIEGSVNGEGMHLGYIDDPLKDRKEARSAKIRNDRWDWFTDVFQARMDEMGGIVAIMTRWHVDDMVGRLQQAYPDARVVSYPAIAEQDEEHRRAGEALFPEHKSLEFILERKQSMTAAGFQSVYQQRPIVEGGELFKEDWFDWYDVLPPLSHKIITADTALEANENNDFSVFECWGRVEGENRLALVDMIRGQWEYPELKRRAVAFAEKHASGDVPLRAMHIERKVSGTSLIQDLRESTEIPVMDIRRSRASKEDRAEDVLGHVASGRVLLPLYAPWVKDFVSEVTSFPAGANDDQVDPMVDALEIELNKKRSSVTELRPLRATHV